MPTPDRPPAMERALPPRPPRRQAPPADLQPEARPEGQRKPGGPRAASTERLRGWAESPQAKEEPEELDDFAIIERIVPRTKPRGILGISFGSIKIDDDGAVPFSPPAPPPPEPDEAVGPEAVPEPEAVPRKKSLFSLFRKKSGEAGEAEAPPPADREAEKATRKQESEARRERKKAEKQARKEARRDVPETEVETGNDDLPGPPPESLRRPYPELRKPISAKRARPEPFPELRKPPDQRRPRPEPFPELRKPAQRPRPEPFPELRKPNREEPETTDVRKEAERQPPPSDKAPDTEKIAGAEEHGGTDTPEAETERAGGGWLSGVLKSAERSSSGAELPTYPWETENGETGGEEAAAAPQAELPPQPDRQEEEAAPPAEQAPPAQEAAEEAPQPEEIFHPEEARQPEEAFLREQDGEAAAHGAEDQEWRSVSEESGQAGHNGDAAMEAAADDFAFARHAGQLEGAPSEEADTQPPEDGIWPEEVARAETELPERTIRGGKRRRTRAPAPGQLELGLPADPPEADTPETPDGPPAPTAETAAEQFEAPDGPERPDAWEQPEPPDAWEQPEPGLREEAGPLEGWGPPESPEPLEPQQEWAAAEPQDEWGAPDLQEEWQPQEPLEAPETYGAPDAEPVDAFDPAGPEAVPDFAETSAPGEETEESFGEEAAETPELPRYADLLDPTYRPRHGFMDLGRRSILFPSEEDESADAADDDGAEPAHDPEWDGAEEPAAPFDPAYTEHPEATAPEGDRYAEPADGHNGGGEDATLSFRSAETGGGRRGGARPEPAPADGWYDDDDLEDEAPAFVAPEPTGRPDAAAARMRSIAHADTEYYLPPPKTPGMVLLGVTGAVLGAMGGNLLYNMLGGDIIVPRFMVILIGIQIFGWSGVFLGAAVRVPLGAPKRRVRSRAAKVTVDRWAGEDWDFDLDLDGDLFAD